ncbi:MAG: hypothetical protein ISS88_00565 [Candidatus Portnoybacteria bacterium]|nr:hypothetical protein [Candidatus Portnoybacteria bacterium]
MRKITTVMIAMIFLAMVMVMATGCATSNKIQKLTEQVAGIDQYSQGLTDQVGTNLKEIDNMKLQIAKLEGFKEGVGKRLDGMGKELAEVKADLGANTDWLNEMEKDVSKASKQVDAHKGKFSDLQRRLAETEDEIRPVYLWTKEFPSGLPRKPKEKEKLAKPPLKIRNGLDNLAIEILAGTLALGKKVVGYADPRGKEKDNQKLSKRRAQSCINYLLFEKLGPEKDVLWKTGTKWKDYFEAVAGGETSRYGNFKFNRRVHFQKKK